MRILIVIILFSLALTGHTQNLSKYKNDYSRMIDSSNFYLKLNPAKSLSYTINAWEIARLLKDNFKITESQLQLGIIYRLRGNLILSEKHLNNARALGKNSELYPAILKESGITVKQQYRYGEALDFYLQAIKFYEEKKQLADIAVMHNNIGRLYFAMNDEDKAMHHYRLALSIAKKNINKITFGIANHNIGTVMERANFPDSAQWYYKKALNNYKNNNDKVLTAYAYASLGNITNNLDSAEHFLHLSYSLRESLGLQADLIESSLYMGKLRLKQGRDFEAMKLFTDAYINATKLNRHEYSFEAAGALSEIHRKLNNLDKALHYEKLSAIWRDSLYKREKKVKELGIDYRINNLKQKETLIKLDEENKTKELRIKASKAELEKEKQLKWFWLTIITLSIIIAVSLAYFAIKLKNNNIELNKQKNIIEQKSLENEILVREVHHRVKNNLNTMMSLLRIEKRKYKNTGTDDLVNNVENRLVSIAYIHEILYNLKDLTSVELHEYLELVAKKIISLYPYLNITFVINGKVITDADKALYLGQIIAELVTNSSKHAFDQIEQPRIRIDLKIINNRLNLHYSDNGPGIVNENKNSTFGKKLIESHGRKLNAVIFEQSKNGYNFKIECEL